MVDCGECLKILFEKERDLSKKIQNYIDFYSNEKVEMSDNEKRMLINTFKFLLEEVNAPTQVQWMKDFICGICEIKGECDQNKLKDWEEREKFICLYDRIDKETGKTLGEI